MAAVAGVPKHKKTSFVFFGVCFCFYGLRWSYLCSVEYCGDKQVVIGFLFVRVRNYSAEGVFVRFLWYFHVKVMKRDQ